MGGLHERPAAGGTERGRGRDDQPVGAQLLRGPWQAAGQDAEACHRQLYVLAYPRLLRGISGEEFRKRQLQYATALSGRQEQEARWKECVDIATSRLVGYSYHPSQGQGRRGCFYFVFRVSNLETLPFSVSSFDFFVICSMDEVCEDDFDRYLFRELHYSFS